MAHERVREGMVIADSPLGAGIVSGVASDGGICVRGFRVAWVKLLSGEIVESKVGRTAILEDDVKTEEIEVTMNSIEPKAEKVTQDARPRFEYRRQANTRNEVLLNQYGAEGWELVSVTVIDNKEIFYFKRALVLDKS